MPSQFSYATLVFHDIYEEKYLGAHITHSEEETLTFLRSILFDDKTHKLKSLDEDQFPMPVTLVNTAHLTAYELANLNNNNEDRSQALYGITGSIGGRIIHFEN
jgi:hypothetical protein